MWQQNVKINDKTFEFNFSHIRLFIFSIYYIKIFIIIFSFDVLEY